MANTPKQTVLGMEFTGPAIDDIEVPNFDPKTSAIVNDSGKRDGGDNLLLREAAVGGHPSASTLDDNHDDLTDAEDEPLIPLQD